MTELLVAQGEYAEAEQLRAKARTLRETVEERYWMEEEGFYAFALDGQNELSRSLRACFAISSSVV